MIRRSFFFLLVAVFLTGGAAYAEKLVILDSPRAIDLAQQLRCVTCQGQSLYESEASMAEDMKRRLVQKIEAGQSDDEIREFFVQRYGDYVLFDPWIQKEGAQHWLLRFLPFGFVFLGLAILFFMQKQSVAAESSSETPPAKSTKK